VGHERESIIVIRFVKLCICNLPQERVQARIQRKWRGNVDRGTICTQRERENGMNGKNEETNEEGSECVEAQSARVCVQKSQLSITNSRLYCNSDDGSAGAWDGVRSLEIFYQKHY
jgi:hypothetical protein